MKAPGIAPQMPPPTAPARMISGIRRMARKIRQRERSRRRKKCAHRDLALAADVEDVRTERDADPDPDEQQRDGLHRRRAQGVAVSECTVGERAIAGHGTRAERREHDGADEECGNRRPWEREPGQPETPPVEPWPAPTAG